jgi:hypothetical protein
MSCFEPPAVGLDRASYAIALVADLTGELAVAGDGASAAQALVDFSVAVFEDGVCSVFVRHVVYSFVADTQYIAYAITGCNPP